MSTKTRRSRNARPPLQARGHADAPDAHRRDAGRVAGYQAKRVDEMQAVADAPSLLANIVMAWNTAQTQSVLDRWSQGRGRACRPNSAAGKLAVVQTLATPARSRTMALDPTTHRLYVAAAEFKTPAAAGPDGEPQWPQVVTGSFKVVVYGMTVQPQR
jgi:hypothetical protein